jgi:hypothetical protein
MNFYLVVACVLSLIAVLTGMALIYRKGWRAAQEQSQESPPVVYCTTCGVAVLKDRAKLVMMQEYFCQAKKYYCQSHTPKYDIMGLNNTYYKEMDVDANGEPIGYVKEKGGDKVKGKDKGMEKGKKGGKCK